MNLMGCLDRATSGEYFIDNIEISKYSEKKLAYLRNKKLGFIFQGFNLLQNLSAYGNVELPLIYQGLSFSERKERVLNALKIVGMKDRIKHKPNELSGGQQQRVAIARALATKPMCILADEPTGNLDSSTGNEIMKILKDLNNSGTTIVIITHNDEIAKFSRRVIKIYDGKIESDIVNEEIDSYHSLKMKELKIKEESLKNQELEEIKYQNNLIKIEEKDEIQKVMQEEIKVEEKNTDLVEEKKVRTPKTAVRKKENQEQKILIKSKKSSNKEGR